MRDFASLKDLVFIFFKQLLLFSCYGMLRIEFSFSFRDQGYSIKRINVIEFGNFNDNFLSIFINMWLELLTKWGNCGIEPSDFLVNVFSLINLINFFNNTWICVLLDSFCPVLSHIMDQLINVNVFGFEQFIILPKFGVQILSLV